MSVKVSNKESVDVFAFMQNDEDSSKEESEDDKVDAAEKHQESLSSSSSSAASSIHQPQRSPRFADLHQRSPRYVHFSGHLTLIGIAQEVVQMYFGSEQGLPSPLCSRNLSHDPLVVSNQATLTPKSS